MKNKHIKQMLEEVTETGGFFQTVLGGKEFPDLTDLKAKPKWHDIWIGEEFNASIQYIDKGLAVVMIFDNEFSEQSELHMAIEKCQDCGKYHYWEVFPEAKHSHKMEA